MLSLCIATFGLARGASVPAFHPQYRLGKAPKPAFKVGGSTYKISPEAKSTKQIRALAPEHFDPTTRGKRVEDFYRTALKEHYEDLRRHPKHDSGLFRDEFLHWVHHWPARSRARWAWHHREYLDKLLWADWMADAAFAAEIADLQLKQVPVEVGYLPAEYAATSAEYIYIDEYLNAAYNPIPLLVVLKLKSLRPDEKTDWIGTAAADSLVSKLSSIPGVYLAEREDVAAAMRGQKLAESDAAEPGHAMQIGKALDVQQAIVGSYVVDGDKVLFNLRIVDVQTGAVRSGLSNTVARDHLLDAMPGLASSLAATLGFPTQEESSPGTSKWNIADGRWERLWTEKGADLPDHSRKQVYTVFDGGRRVKAFSWDLPIVQEKVGDLSIEGSHFFQVFQRINGGISVREWKNRASYLHGDEPIYIGVFTKLGG